MTLVFATFLPLIAFLIQILGGKRLGKFGSLVATAAIGLGALLSSYEMLSYVAFDRPYSLQNPHAHGHDDHGHADHGADPHDHPKDSKQADHKKLPKSITDPSRYNPATINVTIPWATFSLPGQKPFQFNLGYRIDNITVMMFTMITIIATCIHLYAMGYMSHEPRYHRFFAFLSLFCFSMLALVLANNFFQVFLCWELVGVCSYFLIGFYYEKRSASNAANKAFITNRVGDMGFIIGLMVMFVYLGSFDFETVFKAVRNDDGSMKAAQALPISTFWLTVAGIGVFVGCVGKSAQFPLHVWLPDAMEGPTPVSALVHSATMVAAGVYLTARSLPLMTDEALLVITYVGAITLFVAATIAVVSTDIKKALAYSTISQLGYMMLALGIGGFVAGLMHLVTHAFFKSLLFLCSGSVIHGTGTQEMPQMGGLFKKMPITAITMLIGVLAICGFPLTSGFYSKDAIIAQVLAFGSTYPQHWLVMLLPIITAGITAFYMCRLWFMTFTGKPRDAHVYDHAHESTPIMTIPLRVLSVLAIIAAGFPGMVWLEYFIAFGEPASVTTGMLGAAHEKVHGMHSAATVVASLVAGAGMILAAGVYYFNAISADEARRHVPWLYDLFANKWYFDELYRFAIVRPTMILAEFIYGLDKYLVDRSLDGLAQGTVQTSRLSGAFDTGIVDGLVNLIARKGAAIASSFHQVQTGWLRGYVIYLAAGTVGLVAVAAAMFR